jgi:hypothetical protein
MDPWPFSHPWATPCLAGGGGSELRLPFRLSSSLKKVRDWHGQLEHAVLTLFTLWGMLATSPVCVPLSMFDPHVQLETSPQVGAFSLFLRITPSSLRGHHGSLAMVNSQVVLLVVHPNQLW